MGSNTVGRTQRRRVIYDVVSGKKERKSACSHCPRFPRALGKNTIWTREAFGLDAVAHAIVASPFILCKLGICGSCVRSCDLLSFAVNSYNARFDDRETILN